MTKRPRLRKHSSAELSLTWIADRIVEWFANRIGRPQSWFNDATDLKNAINHDAASWRAMAGTINLCGWMAQRHLRIAGPEMDANTTVGKLAKLIHRKAHAQRASAGVSGGDVEAAAETLPAAPPKRAKKR